LFRRSAKRPANARSAQTIASTRPPRRKDSKTDNSNGIALRNPEIHAVHNSNPDLHETYIRVNIFPKNPSFTRLVASPKIAAIAAVDYSP
jgi:hypothetical protein